MESDKLRACIIGCGNNGRGQSGRLSSTGQVEVVAGMDILPERISNVRESAPGAKYYDDFKKMIYEEKPDIVAVGSPHNVHYEQAVFAMEKGCNVLLEKPMALHAHECIDILAKAREKGILLQVDFEARVSLLYKRVKDIIDTGELGEILSISYTHHRSHWSNSWYCSREMAGTHISIETCHYLDLMRFWLGREVEWVFAAGPCGNIRTDYEYPDTTFCILGFEGGIPGSIHTSHARSADLSSLPFEDMDQRRSEIRNPIYGAQLEYTIVGERASLWVDSLHSRILIYERREKEGDMRWPELALKRVEDYNHESMHNLIHYNEGICSEFVERVCRREKTGPEMDDAVRTHLAIFAIEESEEKREKVYVKY